MVCTVRSVSQSFPLEEVFAALRVSHPGYLDSFQELVRNPNPAGRTKVRIHVEDGKLFFDATWTRKGYEDL